MNELKFYTNSTATVTAVPGAVSLVYKKSGTAPVTVAVSDGVFTFSTGADPGSFYFQMVDADGGVIASGMFTVLQDIAHAEADFDPRSDAVKTLEALDAKIAGRALTIQQSKISVGDRSIEYMNSIDELLKWREHFATLVAREQGRGTPKAQVCKLRRS